MWFKTENIQGMSAKTKLSRRYGVKSKDIGVIVKIKFFRRDGVKSEKNWRDGVNFGSARGASYIILKYFTFQSDKNDWN